MPTREPKNRRHNEVGVFAVSCWLLGVVAFLQLMVAGMALANRFERSRLANVAAQAPPEPIIVRVPAAPSLETPPLPAASALSSPAPFTPPPAMRDLPPPTPLNMPAIADPVGEKLVNEAREARIAGDMASAIAKLESALAKSPDEPVLLYEMGVLHEQMGVFDTASSYYQKVFDLGQTKAGSLYANAARKLRDGLAVERDVTGKMTLDRIQIYNDKFNEEAQRVVLTIPIEKAPSEEIDPTLVGVTVLFYNKNSQGEIVQREETSQVSERWLSPPFGDFADGTETLRIVYTLPRQSLRDEHLFGKLEYYGQVVTLTYGNQILDVDAWPRDLAARSEGAGGPSSGGEDPMLLPEFQDAMPPDYDPDTPLLPVPLGP